MKTTNLLIVPLLVCAIAIPVSAQRNADIANIGTRDINDGDLGAADLTDVSFEDEIEMGRSLAAELEGNVTVLDGRLTNAFVPTGPEPGDTPVAVSDDVAITDYVDGVGQRLVANSDARVPFTFKVIDDASVNGLALPGGFVYVNTGLLAATSNEAELASALSHLVAHVTARHGVENQAKGTLLNILSIPLIFVGGVPGAELERAASYLAVPTAIYRFSRAQVDEADYLGVQYLYKAGYDPAAAIALLETVRANEPGSDARESPVFASHRATADRIEAIRRNITEILPQRDSNLVTTPEFADMRARLGAR